jgi:DNA-binding MarR family transcriptional regulator
MNRPLSLKQAIKQTQEFQSEQVEALLTLIWAQDRIAQVANQPLRNVDLSSAQYNVLRILRGSPDGLPTREVVERMVTRAPNITRLVDKLEAKGYLKRRRISCDRRVIHLQIPLEPWPI